MEQSRDIFGTTLGMELEYEEYMQQYRTRFATSPVGETYIELLEPVHEDTDTARRISLHGAGLFHICFEVDDSDDALSELKRKGILKGCLEFHLPEREGFKLSAQRVSRRAGQTT